jgi:hypothetical protein
MRRRSLRVLGFAAAVSIACGALWLTLPVDCVTREAFARIPLGMTAGEVEEVLGRPPTSGSPEAIICFEGVPESFADPGAFPAEKVRQWVGRDHAILVELDERDRVSGRYFGHVNRPERWFESLLRRLGL